MTEGQKEAAYNRLCAADAATQYRIAEAIRCFPETPIYGVFTPAGVDAQAWAMTAVEAGKHADMAHYLSCLAWFYAAARPTNALEKLIEAKCRVIKNGDATRRFWAMLGGLEV